MDRIGVALVGAGFMGRMHGQVYEALEGVELLHVVDKERERAAGVAATHGASVSSYDEALADPSVHAVDVCLPTDLHATFSVRALEAGKHVVCEKPMALSIEEADRMIDAASRGGRRLMIAHCIRFWPAYVELERLVREGSLGRLLSLTLNRFSQFPTWGSDNWLADERRAGGAALDLHIHDTDYALHLMGRAPDRSSSFGNRDARGLSHVATTMTFGETVVHTEGSWNLPAGTPFKMAFRATFERGAAIMDGGPLTIHSEAGAVVPEMPRMAAGAGGNIDDLGGYFYELRYFYDRLKDGAPLDRITPESARASLAFGLKEIAEAGR